MIYRRFYTSPTRGAVQAVIARLLQKLGCRAECRVEHLASAANGSNWCEPIFCKKLSFSQYGDPMTVLSKEEEKIDSSIKGKQVLLRILAAPLNPADINTVQGTYAVKVSSFPAVLGNEGVGEVLAIGDEVEHMEPGDWVIPFHNQFGTCRSHAITEEDQLIKIRKTVPLVEAATLSVNPCTAFRMLDDFVSLNEGDVVIQNGANSAVGQAVIQLCRIRGFRTVNIVRSRENLDELRDYLTELGATEVLTEEELRKTELFRSSRLPRPVLGLNCVGGASGTELARQLAASASLVTYGAMSRGPLALPAALLLFRDLRVRGFWMTRWTRAHSSSPARWEMLDQLQTLCEQKLFRAPRHELVHIDDFQRAVERTMPSGGRVGAKQVLVFDRQLLADRAAPTRV